MKFPKLSAGDAPCDVMLLLEGTYPYVRGGVSSWINHLMHGLPDLRFGAVFIGGQRADYGEPRYELPDNLVHVEEYFLMEAWSAENVDARRGKVAAFEASDALHQSLKQEDATLSGEQLKRIVEVLGKRGGLTKSDFFYSEASWTQIGEYYKRYCTDPSFVDYFWTVRTTHALLFDLMEIARNLPPTRLLHAISTGYAGFLGALAHQHNGTPFALTEHGIYTKERRIDLAQAQWVKDFLDPLASTLEQDISYTRHMWIRFFEGLGRMIYSSADAVTALFETNRQQQIRDGATPEKTRNIPNGIALQRFRGLRARRSHTVPPVLALIGRVVSIKDIKTYIRGMRIVCNRMPEAEGWVIGPEDEDPGYAEECHKLIGNLGLEQRVRFLGFQDMEEVLPRIGLNVLTSISEGQPLVVLEGFAAGVPAVTTDVGNCRQLIYGAEPEDTALGPAGAVVPIANPGLFAEAAVRLLSDPHAWHAAQTAAIERVERFYGEGLMFDRYRKLYEDNFPAAVVSTPSGARG